MVARDDEEESAIIRADRFMAYTNASFGCLLREWRHTAASSRTRRVEFVFNSSHPADLRTRFRLVLVSDGRNENESRCESISEWSGGDGLKEGGDSMVGRREEANRRVVCECIPEGVCMTLFIIDYESTGHLCNMDTYLYTIK